MGGAGWAGGGRTVARVSAAEGDSVGGGAVGRVLGTEDATPLKFWVAVSGEHYLQLDDVVVTTRHVPGHGEVEVAGVVTEVAARHEGAQFASDTFLIWKAS